MGDPSSVVSQVDSMRELASQLCTSLEEGVAGQFLPSSVHSAIHKANAWYTSAKRFVQHLRKEYPLYWDLLAPFAAGVSQVGKQNATKTLDEITHFLYKDQLSTVVMLE